MSTKPNYLTRIRCNVIATALGVASLITLVGCGTKLIHATGDPDDVQELVADVLEAWQSGQTPEDLLDGCPAMHINDEDWDAGKALKAFAAAEPPVERGGHWRVSALLTLSAAGTADVQKAVAYAVTTEPAITIIRVDDVE
jgi:hypothetical protein